jgi:predicted branched-subunit amino acid permease
VTPPEEHLERPSSADDGRSRFRAGMRAGSAYAVAAGIVGITFGVVAEPVLGGAATVVFSAIVFAGSAQFASTAVLGAGGGALAAIIAGLFLNARYGPMGIALAPSLRGGALRRALVGQAMIDASWAMANRGGGRFDPAFMIGATLPSYPAWVGGTALGVVAGDLLGDPESLGLDAIFPAFFLALLVTELRSPRGRGAALIGALVAFALIPIAPPGVPILAASVGALLGLRRSERHEDPRIEEPEVPG